MPNLPSRPTPEDLRKAYEEGLKGWIWDKEVEEEYIFEFYEQEEHPLKACVNFIETYKKGYIKGDAPYILGPDDKPFKITDDRIFTLPECEEMCKIGFVDGGNSPILNSADFCISFGRVAGTIFRGDKWIQPDSTPELIEFYTVTILNPKVDKSLEFITRFFPREPEYRDYLPKKDIKVNMKSSSTALACFRQCGPPYSSRRCGQAI